MMNDSARTDAEAGRPAAMPLDAALRMLADEAVAPDVKLATKA